MKDLQTVLDALEYHVAQTRPIQSTTEAIEIVKQMMQAEPVGYVRGFDPMTGRAEVIFKFLQNGHMPVDIDTLVYAAPQAVPAEPSCPDCHAPHLLYECVHCSASNYPAAPVVKEYEMEPHDQNWIHGEDV